MQTNPDSQLKQAQDLKAINDEYNIRQNPEKYRADVAAKTSAALSGLTAQNRSKFAKAFNDLGKHFDMEDSTINYSNRNQDVIEQNNHNLNSLSSSVNHIKYNKDISRRQVEINEWYYQDKLETLFFMQIFFMAMLAMCIVFYFRKSAMISSRFAGYLTFILLLIVGLTCFYRYFYTNKFRDPRWWYKRRFAKPVYTEENKCGCVDDPFLPKKTACPAKAGKGKCMSGLQGATSIGQAMQSRGVLGAIGSYFDNTRDSSGTANTTLSRAQKQIAAQSQSNLQTDVPADASSTCNKVIMNTDWLNSNQTVGSTPGSSNNAVNKTLLPIMGIPSYMPPVYTTSV